MCTPHCLSEDPPALLLKHYMLCVQEGDMDRWISSPQLWLACSADRRVSVWSAEWGRDLCDLVDWLTFPAPAFTPDGTPIKGKAQVCIHMFSDIFTYTHAAHTF